MKSPKSPGIHRPFKNLRTLLKDKSRRIPAVPAVPAPAPVYQPQPQQNEDRLFREAMSGVKPLASKDTIVPVPPPPLRGRIAKANANPERDVIRLLDNLIKRGEGFIVADTPEYMEGSGYNESRDLTRRLHRGQFSIQAHVDLHGLNVDGAREVFENFLKEAIATGKRAVMVVHGRGLSSPHEPVLKTKVYKWLSYGPFRKWVMAFASAREYDGGAGATYVLLRQRPVTKRFRKKAFYHKKNTRFS